MKDFTSQQKEIVARKLGYDGPMQGFDEFIASSPSLGAKYAAITGKFAERMARGGLVKMKRRYAAGGAVTDEQIAAWWADPANQKLSDAEIKAAMDTYKVSPDQFSRAIGANEATAADIATRYEAAPSTPAVAEVSDAVTTSEVTAPVGGTTDTTATTGSTPFVGGTTDTTATTGSTPFVGGTTVGGGEAAGKAVAQKLPASTYGYKATPQNIADWWKENASKGLTDAQIKANMAEFQVSPEEFAKAIGANEATTE